MLQNSSATKIIIAQTEEHVRKTFRIILTRAPARHTLPASIVNLVSCHVPFLLHTNCLSERLRCHVKSAKYIVEILSASSIHDPSDQLPVLMHCSRV